MIWFSSPYLWLRRRYDRWLLQRLQQGPAEFNIQPSLGTMVPLWAIGGAGAACFWVFTQSNPAPVLVVLAVASAAAVSIAHGIGILWAMEDRQAITGTDLHTKTLRFKKIATLKARITAHENRVIR